MTRARKPHMTVLTDQFSSVQFKMVSMCSEKPICAPPRLSEGSRTLPFETECSSDWRWPGLSRSSFQGRSSSASSFHAFPLQAMGRWCGALGALYPQVVSQAPQHSRASETKGPCDGCCVRQYICSVLTKNEPNTPSLPGPFGLCQTSE